MKTFLVNEIFRSLQGEGKNTGRAATFIRFKGCNCKCPFCDTNFSYGWQMTVDEILAEVGTAPYPGALLVMTGGEPFLQVTDPELPQALISHGWQIAVESNGTIQPSQQIRECLSCLTISPKRLGDTPLLESLKCVDGVSELKVLSCDLDQAEDLAAKVLGDRENPPELFVQPCVHVHGPDMLNNSVDQKEIRTCIDFIAKHPRWRLSLQTHKLIQVR